jgi:hypothetical protein
MVGSNWVDKTPMLLVIGYLTVVPKDDELKQIMVSKMAFLMFEHTGNQIQVAGLLT